MLSMNVGSLSIAVCNLVEIVPIPPQRFCKSSLASSDIIAAGAHPQHDNKLGIRRQASEILINTIGNHASAER